MGIGTILIGIALLVVVAALVVAPLLEKPQPANEPLSARETLEIEHQSVLRAIREIDLDYRTHKLSEADYKDLRRKQVEHGADILRTLDAFKSDEQIDEEIEAQVAALRSTNTMKVERFCTQCGKPVKENDRFCAQCGATLEPTHEETPS